MGYGLLDQLKLIYNEEIYKDLANGSWNDDKVRGILSSLENLKERLCKYDISDLKLLKIHALGFYKNSQVTGVVSALVAFILGIALYLLKVVCTIPFKTMVYIGCAIALCLIGSLGVTLVRNSRCRVTSIVLSEIIQLCINEKSNSSKSDN